MEARAAAESGEIGDSDNLDETDRAIIEWFLANTCTGEKMKDNTVLLEAMLRHDFPSFVAKTFSTLCPGEIYLDNWHLECLTWRSRRRRTEARAPDNQFAATISKVDCGVSALPACFSGKPLPPHHEVSYSDELARKHARDTRTILEAPCIGELFRQRGSIPQEHRDRVYYDSARFSFGNLHRWHPHRPWRRRHHIDDPIKPAMQSRSGAQAR